jgi:putrescine transport system ATP-binding protein
MNDVLSYSLPMSPAISPYASSESATAVTQSKPAEPSFLRIEGLTKRFGNVTAVDNVSLAIPRGEIFALLGSSGCGKSTLLRMLAGFEKPSEGHIFLGDEDIASFPPYERPINMMFQSYALFPHLNVWDNIAFGLRRMGMPKDELTARVEKMLELVQLQSFAKRKPDQLSGGQQQRVALARSLARKPQLLLLDEPLGALDKKLREQTQFELVNIIESIGVTCVMVTHDQDEAMTMANRIAIMSKGQILQLGQPRDVYETPNCRFVADFIGDVNLLEGELTLDHADRCEITTAHTVVHVNHGITGTLGMKLAVAIRPEKIQIAHDAPQQSHNVVQGKVHEIAYSGSYNTFEVLLGDGTKFKVTQANVSRHELGHISWNDHVYCWWDDSSPVALTA